MAFMYRDMHGECVSRVLSPYFLKWLDGFQRCFSCCSLLTLLFNGQNIAKCEAYWLMGVPIINPWGTHQTFFLVQRYVQIN